ncbi:transposase [Deinococcus soli (ex Cha et al. 2016)]|uniref:Transposase n=2 Tax=Deinococcus soli (ex Cha et al. 2016) TaxID=1309411 RepID=A0AAE3XCJ5_9DEIO|nr:transposase [Deinococcus soli (ex Cha et al. 2016)]MDR6218816.1 putative transposase [Deinococcus soli (ex Cha et al. 2016)]MDR6328613.1 putative transposase [Deinococcus soli (ex Cha et al. 2016)]MDR6751900.1 putative transposase [Deinococcus soli (ex Cha et al. 2016)]
MESTTLRAFKYRLYPTKAQITSLDTTLALCQRLYNGMLEERRGAYQKAGKSLTAYDQMKSLPEVKAALPEYAGVNAQVLQDVAKRLDKSFKGFFRRVKAGQKAGYPRFRSRDRYDSFTYPQPSQNSVSGDGKHVYLPKIGNVRIKLHRPFAGKLKTLAVKRDGQEWYAVLTCEIPRPAPLPQTGNAVGIDLGVAHLVITSDGEFVDNPRPLRSAQKRLRVLQRSLSRKKRGSKRRHKARRAVARLHLKVKRQRDDLHHKVAVKLVRENDWIAHENLSITGLARTRMARSVLDAGWGSLIEKLISKAVEAGRTVVGVHPAYTSQDCHLCGHREKHSLSVREFTCKGCGALLNRDVNAAKNILAWSMPSWTQGGSVERACPEKSCPLGLG